jgi:hypothetical protein
LAGVLGSRAPAVKPGMLGALPQLAPPVVGLSGTAPTGEQNPPALLPASQRTELNPSSNSRRRP